MNKLSFISALLLSAVSGKVYFEETFSGKSIPKKWVQSEAKEDYGKFQLATGEYYGDKEISQGLQTSEDARFYSISAPLDTPFKNAGKDLVVQFSAKFEKSVECGGGYIKVLEELDQKQFKDDTNYNIMFGPDICGSDRKVHAILNYKDENHLITKHVDVPDDSFSHQYTLIIHPDQTYKILVDNEESVSGNITEDWSVLPPKEIDDPKDKKPEDWIEEQFIVDPEDKKPDDWVDGPETITDPEAKKPEDWDDDADGEWEAPLVPNPEYKGEWAPKQITNPEYKGEWAPKKIANPDYKEDSTIGQYTSNYLGFDLWQVKSGSIFDDVLLTDDVEYAKKFSEKNFVSKQEGEKEAKKKADEEAEKKAEEERKKAEEEAAAKKAEETEEGEEVEEESKEVKKDSKEADDVEDEEL